MVPVKGMNDFHTLAERQQMTQILIDREKDKVDKQGFNPITEKYMAPDRPLQVVERLQADTPFTRALQLAIPLSTASKGSKEGMKCALNIFRQAAEYLGLEDISISDITSGHLMDCLNECHRSQKISPRKKDGGKLIPITWNENQYNFVRGYIGMIYKVIKTRQILPHNPMHNIPKKEIIKAPGEKRKVLTDSERKAVAAELVKWPEFWRYANIFHASGSRIAEMARLQGKHVDLDKPGFWILIYKGKKKKWAFKTITLLTLPYWQSVMEGCKPDDFVFSRGLKPGAKATRPEQVTRRWERHSKKKLGIDVDFYALKHLFDSEVIDQVMEEERARKIALKIVATQNGHAGPEMLERHYDVRKDEREHAFRKTLGRPLG